MRAAKAAMTLARFGQRVLLITGNVDRIGHLSCNPAIGGLAKGIWSGKSTPSAA